MQNLLAVQNSDVLRRLAGGGFAGTISALARELERDESNLRKTIAKLREADLVSGDAFTLTEQGVDLIPRLDVLDGMREVGGDLLMLQHRLIKPNPDNPRKDISHEGLEELAGSIAGMGRIIAPLLVFPAAADGFHMLAAGERRWRAVEILIDDGRWVADRPLPCMLEKASPARTHLLALVENGAREPMARLETARAIAAEMETSKRTAADVAKEAGMHPRVAQEYVKVLREASPSQITAFENGSRTWEWLRDQVKTNRAGYAPPKAKQTDIEDFTAGDAPPESKFAPSPLLALSIYELADKVSKDPTSAFRSGFTPIDAKRFGEWTAPGTPGVIELRMIGDLLEARIDPKGRALRWLESKQFYLDDKLGRGYRLIDARVDAGCDPERVNSLKSSGRYHTEWLNVAQGPADRVTGQPTATSPAAAGDAAAPTHPHTPEPAPPAPLKDRKVSATSTPAEIVEKICAEQRVRLAFLELVHKISTEIATNGVRSGEVESPWLHGDAVWLTNEARLVNWVLSSTQLPRAEFTPLGLQVVAEYFDWIESDLNSWPEVSEDRLDLARLAAGYPARVGPGYITPWLNITPAPQAEADPTSSGIGAAIAGDSLEEEDAVYGELLSKARAFETAWAGVSYKFPAMPLEADMPEDFVGLLGKLGIQFPLCVKDGDELGVVATADGREALTVDTLGEMHPDRVSAIAILIRIAMHVCAGVTTSGEAA
ncbi:MAG: ParB/RepB/Spo0J family partition protein [Caulobacteraceae bacterium]